MTFDYIISTALKQSAVDLSCSPEDFQSKKSIAVISKDSPGARKYLKLPFFFELASYGTNIVASCSPEMIGFAGRFIDRADIYSCFEPDLLYELNDELAKYKMRIKHMADYYLPDPNGVAAALEKNRCRYELRILTQRDFSHLYLPEWQNALCEARRELDVLGVGAYEGDKLVGLAGCSADCGEMRQIGVDVLPDYRREGIAKAIVTRLAAEIMDAGKVPFYCAAWSNVKSRKCAVSSGFRPGWVEITAKPIG